MEGAERQASQPSQSSGGRNDEAAGAGQVGSAELAKWKEMMDQGISRYMRAHPDRFHRRVRRGIPPEFRWRVWKAAVRLEKDWPTLDYKCLSETENQWTSSIVIDVPRTFPDVKSFNEEQQQRLKRVLNAYAGCKPNIGYCQGMNYVAGLLLLVSQNEEESFYVFSQLMDHEDFGLVGFYMGKLPLLRRYLRACENLVAESLPELREHFIKQNVQPAVYLHQWFLTLFINCFPISMVMILWDVIMCEGLPVILRIAVSILQVLKDSLLSMEFEDIIKFFKMMKTYHDEDGELCAVKIGQLLMKHTEHVHIPEETLQYLRPSNAVEDDGNFDSDESWENEHSPWYYKVMSGMWPWGKKKSLSSLSSRSAPVGDLSPSAREAAGARVSGARTMVEDDHPEEGASFFTRGWEFL